MGKIRKTLINNIGIAVIVCLVIAIIGAIIFRYDPRALKCVPSEDKKTIEIITKKNITIESVEVTSDGGILSTSETDMDSLMIEDNTGTEFVTIYYSNKRGEEDSYDFEITVSDYKIILIRQLDAFGNQVDYESY